MADSDQPAPIAPLIGSENGPSRKLFRTPRVMASDLTTPAPAPLATSGPDALLSLTASTSPAAVYLAQLAPESARTMRSALGVIAQLLGHPDPITCPWQQLRYQHTAAIRARLAEAYAPRTVTKLLSALKRVLEEAWRLGLMDAETYRRAVDIKGVRGSRLRPGRAAADDELDTLLAACAADPAPAGVRDAALLAVLAFCGLRRAEVVALQLADYTPASGAIRVRGKGNKERLVYAEDWIGEALRAWLALRGDAPGPLFVAARKGGRLTDRALTGQAVRLILQRRVEAAGLDALRPHDLRRTFISNLLDETDAATAQQLAGHAKIETTAGYDRRPERTRQAAARQLAARRRPGRT